MFWPQYLMFRHLNYITYNVCAAAPLGSRLLRVRVLKRMNLLYRMGVHAVTWGCAVPNYVLYWLSIIGRTITSIYAYVVPFAILHGTGMGDTPGTETASYKKKKKPEERSSNIARGCKVEMGQRVCRWQTSQRLQGSDGPGVAR